MDNSAAGHVSGGSLAFPPFATLTERADFLAAARARHRATPAFVVQARQRNAGVPGADGIRVGFTCSKKVGNAVARNRAKRRLRALARAILPAQGRAGWDYVLIGRAGTTATRDFVQMHEDLTRALNALHAPKGTAHASKTGL